MIVKKEYVGYCRDKVQQYKKQGMAPKVCHDKLIEDLSQKGYPTKDVTIYKVRNYFYDYYKPSKITVQ